MGVAPWWLYISIIVGLIIGLMWSARIMALGLGANAMGKAYLRRLSSIQVISSDMSMFWDNPWLPAWRRSAWRAFGRPQEDTELEQLRREYWKRTCDLMLAMVISPVFIIEMIVAFLTIFGSAH